jgi:hypothetical protein
VAETDATAAKTKCAESAFGMLKRETKLHFCATASQKGLSLGPTAEYCIQAQFGDKQLQFQFRM